MQPPNMQSQTNNMLQPTPHSQPQTVEPVIVKTSISTMAQIQALVSKDYVIFKRRLTSFAVTLGIVIAISFLTGGSPLWVFVGISLIGSLFGRFVIENNIIDRELKFRATFKLMGLRDEAYIIANLVFQLGFSIILSTFYMAFCFLFKPGSFGIFMSLTSGFYFYGIVILFNFSNIMMCNCFSNMIKDTKASKELSNMFIGILLLVPSMSTVKFLIRSLLNDKSDPDSFIDNIFSIFPYSSLLSAYKLNFASFSYQGDGYHFYPFAALALQVLGYSFLYYLTTKFLSNQSGVAFNLFKSSKREDPTGLDTSLLTGEPILERKVISVKNVVKKYGKFKALDGVNCDINSNEVTCILGHNGAGKTTLINAICGINEPSSGKITFDGYDVYSGPGVLAGKVGYCTSQDVLYSMMTVSEFLTFIALMKCVEDPHEEVMRIMKKCDLTSYAGQLVKNLSGGTRRRTTIASAVIGNPKLVVMDEPSSGVDPENRRQLWALIESLKNPYSALILTTHHLEEAEYLSQDVIILDKGKVEIRGSPTEITHKFGIGYNIIVDQLESRTQLNEVIESIKSVLNNANIEVNDTSFETQGKAEIVIPINLKHLMGPVLKKIEEKGVHYNIESNSLEEAFISLGEKKSHASDKQHVNAREQTYNSLFKTSYSSSWFRIFFSLIYRRFALFFSSMVQIFMFLYITIIPGLLLWTFGARTLNQNYIYAMPFLIGVVYLVLCSFYAYLPFYERKYRMRYLLKMLGADSVTYYCNLFLTDLIFSTFLIAANWGFLWLLFLGKYDLKTFDFGQFKWFFLYTVLWSATFITQSYTFQFIFKDTAKSVRSVPYIILGTSLAYLLKLFLISVRDEDTIFILNLIIFLMTPISAYFSLIVNQLFKLNNPGSTIGWLKPKEEQAYIAVLFITPLLYLGMAIMIDFFKTRIRKKNAVFDKTNTLVGQHVVADSNTLEKEAQLAMENRTDIPIQGAKISKVFNSVYSGSFYALKEVYVCLRPSETLGLLGPNGAGKSTLFNILSTYHDVTTGQVKMFGKEISIGSQFFKNTGICAQDEILWDSLSVKTHLNIIRLMKGVPSSSQNKWLELVELERFGSNVPAELSSGMKRKLSFLISAISNPKYKFLDEVTTGLDPMARKRTREIMAFQKKIYGGSTIFTTHTMNEAEKSCDRILILVNGNACVIDSVPNLKRMTNGFNLTLVKNSPQSLGVQLIEVLKPVFPEVAANGFTIIEENESKVTYDVMNVTGLSDKFNGLEGLKEQGLFKDFNLTRKSLEDVFLALSRYQAPRRN